MAVARKSAVNIVLGAMTIGNGKEQSRVTYVVSYAATVSS